jgi:RNA recognition motif-containing protein
MNSTEMKSLYLGNLDYDVTQEELEDLFSRFGKISKLTLIQKKGIAFVTLDNLEDTELAKKALDGIDFLDRKLIVDWARPMKKKPNRKKVVS